MAKNKMSLDELDSSLDSSLERNLAAFDQQKKKRTASMLMYELLVMGHDSHPALSPSLAQLECKLN